MSLDAMHSPVSRQSKIEEGVIKFRLMFEETAVLPIVELAELNAWRQVLVQMQMMGQTAERYGGLGFGNISQRITHPDYQNAFVITGTQTGSIGRLTAEHYATVLACHPTENQVVAEGPIRPSSESMTHGIMYGLAPDIRWVMHVHEPTIWRWAHQLGIPSTSEGVAYGTPEMSAEVERLFDETAVLQKRIFTMAGHEDGVVAFGETAVEAGQTLLRTLAQAYHFYKDVELLG